MRRSLYLLVFVFTLHMTLTIYINSSFLRTLLPAETHIGTVFTVIAIISCLLFLVFEKILQKIGNYAAVVSMMCVQGLACVLLTVTESVPLQLFYFVVSQSFSTLTFISLDIFLEHASSRKEEGTVRGNYMSWLNAAFLIGPVIGAVILTYTDDFKMIYLASAVLLIPALFVIRAKFASFKDAKYVQPNLRRSLARLFGSKDICNISIANFILQFFFSWMVIYTPIFLNVHVGLSWDQIAVVFGVMLIPFIFLEKIFGYLADIHYGEKEILLAGIMITAASTALMSLFMAPSVALWAGLLFVTRIGASMMEIMCDTYFFKKIDKKDIELVGIYRISRPFSAAVAPVVASVVLIFLPIEYLFAVLSVIVLSAAYYAMRINDTL